MFWIKQTRQAGQTNSRINFKYDEIDFTVIQFTNTVQFIFQIFNVCEKLNCQKCNT